MLPPTGKALGARAIRKVVGLGQGALKPQVF